VQDRAASARKTIECIGRKEAPFTGVPHEFHSVVYLDLLRNSCSIRLDSLDTHKYLRGHRSICIARCDPFEQLPLAPLQKTACRAWA
jgi:hypothetical protein